jgi:hypothetical protein
MLAPANPASSQPTSQPASQPAHHASARQRVPPATANCLPCSAKPAAPVFQADPHGAANVVTAFCAERTPLMEILRAIMREDIAEMKLRAVRGGSEKLLTSAT